MSRRGLDWHCALVTAGLGATFMWRDEGLPNLPLPAKMFGMELSHHTWGTVFLVVGLVRVVALLVNGRSPQGAPSLRGGAALVGTVLWSTLCLSYVGVITRDGDLRPGLVFVLAEMLSDVFSAIRAGIELGAVRHRRWRRLADLVRK